VYFVALRPFEVQLARSELRKTKAVSFKIGSAQASCSPLTLRADIEELLPLNNVD
jgi:hypothetical protein